MGLRLGTTSELPHQQRGSAVVDAAAWGRCPLEATPGLPWREGDATGQTLVKPVGDGWESGWGAVTKPLQAQSELERCGCSSTDISAEGDGGHPPPPLSSASRYPVHDLAVDSRLQSPKLCETFWTHNVSLKRGRGGTAGTENQNGADGKVCAWEAATIKGMAWPANPVATGCQGNPCSTGIRWGVSPAAQMGCLRNRSGSPAGADQP